MFRAGFCNIRPVSNSTPSICTLFLAAQRECYLRIWCRYLYTVWISGNIWGNLYCEILKVALLFLYIRWRGAQIVKYFCKIKKLKCHPEYKLQTKIWRSAIKGSCMHYLSQEIGIVDIEPVFLASEFSLRYLLIFEDQIRVLNFSTSRYQKKKNSQMHFWDDSESNDF